MLEGYYLITLSFNFADAAYLDQKFSPHFCCSLGSDIFCAWTLEQTSKLIFGHLGLTLSGNILRCGC